MSWLSIISAVNAVWTLGKNLLGLFTGKKPNTTDQANDRQAEAATDAAQTRDRSDAAIEQDRAETDAGVAAVRDDAGLPDGLQRASDEVNAATDRANAAGRLQ